MVQCVAELYAPPPLSPARRARFDARLAERLDASPARRGMRLAAWLAAAATVLVATYGISTLSPRGSEHVQPVSTASTPPAVTTQDDDAILAMMGPIADANDALPDDYRAISALVIGE